MKQLLAMLGCALMLAACGSDDKNLVNPMDPTPSATASATEAPAKTIDIVIQDGKVTPQGDRVDVNVGEPVTLRVTSDATDEIHVHSEPEHSFAVAAGKAEEFTFDIGSPGQVAVESHHLDVTIVQLVARP